MSRQLKIKISVPFSFNVIFARNVFSSRDFLKNFFISPGSIEKKKVIFFIEDTVAESFPDILEKIESFDSKTKGIELVHPVFVLPGGEQNKNIKEAVKICSILSKNKICRQSIVAVVGGGAFLDTVCFAASISHRGVCQVRFPTTVVSQCDSGLGVKNAVNLFGKKNFAGVFFPPSAVINDFAFLKTLAPRDINSGLAEAIKIAVIKDSSFFSYLEKNTENIRGDNSPILEKIIVRCAKLHADHISDSGDPFEFGNAKPLDFGHWLAHKLESMSKGKMRHGEAVAVGIATDSFYAMKKGLLSKGEFERIINILKSYSLPIWTPFLGKKSKGRLSILDGIAEFREHLGGKLSITLPSGIGSKIEINKIDCKIIEDAFIYFKTISSK
jgi:3-dehydroquinate synthase